MEIVGDLTNDIYQLNPVVFNYIEDTKHQEVYGLIAEEVKDALSIIIEKNGQPESVHYQYLPILMLNEQQKDHAELLHYKQRTHALEKQLATMQQQINDLQEKIEKLLG